jgi:hypothetical protein
LQKRRLKGKVIGEIGKLNHFVRRAPGIALSSLDERIFNVKTLKWVKTSDLK